jgi:putative membrane protein
VTRRLFALAGLGIVFALLISATPAQAAPGDDPAPAPFLIPNDTSGPLMESDKVFLEKVRQAGLWEIPAGQMAAQKGANPRTKEVGRLIAADHATLDDDVRKVAAKLGVPLPNEVTAQQQLWIDELTRKTGESFDDAFAQNLRYAHGAVYSAIAQTRASTRNALMRAFAKQCEIFVHRHMSLLESTGDVRYDALPPPVVAIGNLRAAEKKQPLFLAALLAVAGAIGVASVTRALRAV